MYHIHKYTYRFLFLLSIAVILYATLYREAGQGDIELRLFWTIKRAWSEHSGYYWYLILAFRQCTSHLHDRAPHIDGHTGNHGQWTP